MLIKVDPKGFVPLYEQVKAEIRRLAAVGAVKPHDPLPSIRDLAAEILVNPNTVARAYRELEQEGLITTQKGRGSFLAARKPLDIGRDLGAHLSRRMDEAIREINRFKLGPAEIRKLFEERLRRFEDKERKGEGDE
ncbi:MAG: GntR family transcriptional regulator [Candidatus Aminicenantes bacterium]|nr:GntR family transcriptional regulator [Candidatus Aminicenantes bacterium]